MFITFFDSQGVVHKEFALEGKTVNAEFYKGVMDCILKHNQWVYSAASLSRDLFLSHDNMTAHKTKTPKNVTTLYHPPYSPDPSPPEYYLFPKFKINLKELQFSEVSQIEVAITEELKKVQKEKLTAGFQKLYDRAIARIYDSGAYFEKKESYIPFSCVFDLKKKISPKIFGPHYVGESRLIWGFFKTAVKLREQS
jgi:histone-lysine N-methyltransferase SETMAR